MSAILGPVNERSTAKYTSDPLTDENGDVVSGAILTAATMTFYDQKTGIVINSRDAQNVNQANGVAISNTGVVTWTMDPADNIILNDRLSQEIHVAVFDFRWDGGAKRAVHEFRVAVNNIGKVTS